MFSFTEGTSGVKLKIQLKGQKRSAGRSLRPQDKPNAAHVQQKVAGGGGGLLR